MRKLAFALALSTSLLTLPAFAQPVPSCDADQTDTAFAKVAKDNGATSVDVLKGDDLRMFNQQVASMNSGDSTDLPTYDELMVAIVPDGNGANIAVGVAFSNGCAVDAFTTTEETYRQVVNASKRFGV